MINELLKYSIVKLNISIRNGSYKQACFQNVGISEHLRNVIEETMYLKILKSMESRKTMESGREVKIAPDDVSGNQNRCPKNNSVDQ